MSTASQILDAIRHKHPRLAVVPELTINDMWHREQPDLANIYRRRIDALMFDGGQRTALEIKVSKADAKRETWHKTAPWRNVCHRFIYVTTPDISFSDIGDRSTPSGGANWACGHWVVHPDGTVEVKRKAKVNKYPEPLPNDVILRLAYRASGYRTIGDTDA
ncbi:hypothetical protein [Corynebacterium ulceribovis]|uniref:hypothetical protein n=1 Tax=Corynebacterium ulceribovis TaxID=487732 RepID=UPI0003730CD0|nr:hypothetical protein [Corynebacterium ulceribovis]